MAKAEITIDTKLKEIIAEINSLQTYKMFEGDKELYVSLADVAAVLARHTKIVRFSERGKDGNTRK